MITELLGESRRDVKRDEMNKRTPSCRTTFQAELRRDPLWCQQEYSGSKSTRNGEEAEPDWDHRGVATRAWDKRRVRISRKITTSLKLEGRWGEGTKWRWCTDTQHRAAIVWYHQTLIHGQRAHQQLEYCDILYCYTHWRPRYSRFVLLYHSPTAKDIS